MLNFIKYHLRRYPKYMKAWNSLQWKKHIWSDWLNTYIYTKKTSSMIHYADLR
jgi:hypothetical protein